MFSRIFKVLTSVILPSAVSFMRHSGNKHVFLVSNKAYCAEIYNNVHN